MRNARAITIVALFALLFYTRFVGLDWGLPYPMHPDERNMADAMVRMRCDDITELPMALYGSLTKPHETTPVYSQETPQCLNPHFFAYGQLPLYVGKLLAIVVPEAAGSFTQAVVALRLISAIASCVSFVFMLRIAHRLLGERIRSVWVDVALGLLFIFSPILIQLAHYGTTESLLMMFYLMIVWWSLKLYDEKNIRYRSILWLGILSGLALGTKVSAAPFLLLPPGVVGIRMLALLAESHSLMRSDSAIATNDTSAASGAGPTSAETSVDKHEVHSESTGTGTATIRREFLIEMTTVVRYISVGLFFLLVSGIVFVLSSPYNIISPNEFFSSMRYEGDIGLGRTVAFYTRQFLYEIPVLFQARSILPYALGWGVSLLALAGFVCLPWRDKRMNTVRLAILFVALPTLFIYAKWTRFLAPVYPLLIIIAGVFLIWFYEWKKSLIEKKKKDSSKLFVGILRVIIVTVVIFSILPGIGMLAVYQNEDVRFTASRWIFQNIPAGSVVLSETANVVDLPIASESVPAPANYLLQHTSFDYYKVDEDPMVASALQDNIKSAEYIVVPSRRVFYNHACLRSDGTAGLHSDAKCKQLAKDYPILQKYYADLFSGKLGFKKVAEFSSYPRLEIAGRVLWQWQDEDAEETFSVFDHPVVRVYQRK